MDFRDIKEFIKDSLKYILFIVAVLFVAIYVVGLQQIVGDSMNPTLKNNEVIIIDKLTPKFIDLKRGDIVSFYFDESKFLINRIIGLPGEKVDIKNNKIIINDEVIEDYVNAYTSDFKLSDIGYQKIPEDHYFVLGDNRTNSMDSRDYRVGLIHKKDIIGKRLLTIFR